MSSSVAMNDGDRSPVMTDSERRAYRYGQAASRLRGMRRSRSKGSLASSYGDGGRAMCVCAPTSHPGSFRCKHHRQAHASNPGGAAASHQGMAAPLQHEPFGVKHHEGAHADQEERSP